MKKNAKAQTNRNTKLGILGFTSNWVAKLLFRMILNKENEEDFF